ncbi:MAG: VOC family protein [Pleurocapsa sp.]
MNLTFKGTRLLVSDYEACLEFYQNILGFELIYQSDRHDEADLKLGDTRLNIIKRQTMAEIVEFPATPVSEDIPNNLALIFTTKDLDKTCHELEQKNVALITKPVYRPQWGIKTVYLRDPNRNLIGIYQITDDAII